MNFLQRTPFFRLLLAVISGIILFRYCQLTDSVIVIAISVSILAIFSSFLIKNTALQYRFRWLFGVGVFLLFCAGSYQLCRYNAQKSEFYPLYQKNVFIAKVSSAPVEKTKSIRCEIIIEKQLKHQKWQTANGKAVVYLEKSEKARQLLAGDEIILRSEFKEPPGAENPDGFNYAAYLKQNGIGATAYISTESWFKTATNPEFSLSRLASLSRTYLLSIFRNYKISGDEFAVLAALTLGYTDDLQPDLRSSYSATGAMHILSVSGLHVGIVYIVIAFLLSFLKKNRFQFILKAILIVLFLWMYAFITGLSPSVVRSALMFSFVAIGSSLERKSQIYNTVFMSAFFMLLIQPDFLYNIGFQLSYAAVLSILIFQKPFASLLPVRSTVVRWFRDLITVSVAAQIGTIPFTLFYFQQFPNYFLLTNLIAIPLSTIVIYLAMILLATSAFPIIATLIAYLLKWTLWLQNNAIVYVQHLPYSTATISLDFNQLILLFIVFGGITMYFYTKKAMPLILGLVGCLATILLSLQTLHNTQNTDKIIVYSSQKSLHINFIQKGKNFIHTADSEDLIKIASPYWKRNKIGTPVKIDDNDWFKHNYAVFANKRIIIATEKLWKNKTTGEPLKADFLIIGNKAKPKIKYLLENIQPETVIVDKSVSGWYTENIRKVCSEKSIPFYSIAEKGAFVFETQH